MILETTKTINRTFNLEPFGSFLIKWVNTEISPRTLSAYNLTFIHDKSMPLTPEQHEDWIKEMKKQKTDVFVDENGRFYSRGDQGIVEISHQKLIDYQKGENGFRELIDNY